MKKYLLIAILIIPILKTNGQGLGELAPDKEPVTFPPNSWGVDIMFGEGGPGLGAFLRKEVFTNFTAFTDVSFSEAKDEREIEYVDIFGNTYTYGKINRIFLIPFNVGLQYRLFSETLTDNLRPYINLGIGPSIVLTTPYDKEYFSAFGKTQAKYTVGGYVGLGANFGLDKNHLIGINLRYYLIQLFGQGVESLQNDYLKQLGGFYLTINIGMMY